MFPNKFGLGAMLLLAPALHAASPAQNFATGIASLTAATAVTLAGYQYGPSRHDIGSEALGQETLLKAFALPTGLYVGFKLANYGHKKMHKATSKSPFLKRVYSFGNGLISLALFYKSFLQTENSEAINPYSQAGTKAKFDAAANALATYGIITWGVHLINNAQDSFKTAFEKEKIA